MRGLATRLRAAALALRVLAAYLVTFEVAALLAAARGRTGEAGRALAEFERAARRLLTGGLPRAGLPVEIPADLPVPHPDRPLIVLARHAGTLNVQLVLALVAEHFGRRPCGVAKRVVRLDPALGMLLRRTGIGLFRWDAAGRAGAMRYLVERAARLGPRDALVIFPEGTNLTAARRRRIISGLLDRGDTERARWAARLRHVLPPVRAGAAVSLAGAPEADVVVLGHSGLEELVGWAYATCCPLRGAPRVRVRWWHTPAERVPRTAREAAAWVDEQWAQLDAWLATQHDASPTAHG